ncbi:MAG: hypothetical protein JWS12_480 [Candidatus Saccharibacteria bacterium]|nr:hypothetical protein [Candidatus Saccharibacteria bacterium]
MGERLWEERLEQPELAVVSQAFSELGQLYDIDPVTFGPYQDEIIDLYSAPWRVHHDVSHLSYLIDFTNAYQDRTDLLPRVFSDDPTTINKGLVLWMIMYHDAIQDTHTPQGEDEQLSADVAKHRLTELRLPKDHIREIALGILASTEHRFVISQNIAFFLDADVAILGAAPDRYDQYAQAIRKEYEWVPEERYRHARANVLHSFLDTQKRPTIFLTDFGQKLFEEPARQNIQRELASLEVESP